MNTNTGMDGEEAIVDAAATGGINYSRSDDNDYEELYVEFASKAVEEELARLNEVKAALARANMAAARQQQMMEDENEDYEEDYDYDYDDEGEYDSEDYDEEEEEEEDEWADVHAEAELAAYLDPDLWYRFSYWELHAYFSCAAAFKVSRAPYDSAKWNDLRQYYHHFVALDKVDKPLDEGEEERSFQYSTEAYHPPLETFQTEGKGRGLMAARDIDKGELVFKATNNTVIFTHGHTWRKFLFAIYERYEEEVGGELDQYTTCDVLVWSWVQRLTENGPLVIVADLDNGSLMNEGREEEGWEPPNTRCGKEGERCEMAYYATKDIRKGEEILCDYREFALLNAWPRMGL